MKSIIGTGTSGYPPVSRAKRRGFTLVEVLLVSFILGVVLVGLFLTLNIGQRSFSLSSAKVDLQSQVRAVINWVINDVRDTNPIEINSNDPGPDHIKFRKVTGIDNSTGNYAVTANYIEYTYNPASFTLTRSEVDPGGVVLKSIPFYEITQSPFYNGLGGVLQTGDIIRSWDTGGKRLIIVISGRKQLRGSEILDFSLTEEAKVRNE